MVEMKIFKDPKKLQAWCRSLRADGKRVALVPTMGYLHEGHISLVEAARRKGADEIIVSIFVNPVQFGPNEDFEKYPRDEKADLKKCRAAGVGAVFLPTPETMYKDGHSVYIDEELLSKGLCGARRPGHFRGVCTVVAKLFNLTHPNFAVFGQKDFQQAQVIKRMVRDLNFDLEVVVAPIIREGSGLAKSSRNTYLSEKERAMASEISAGLSQFTSTAALRRRLEKAGLKVDYVECVDSETLSRRKHPVKGCTVLVAAYAGSTRLIDNRML
jgi:pantoate--beta-alanine ligase